MPDRELVQGQISGVPPSLDLLGLDPVQASVPYGAGLPFGESRPRRT